MKVEFSTSLNNFNKGNKVMPKKNVHVVKRPDGWGVLKEGNSRVSKKLETKNEALKVGRDIAKQDKVELVIHNMNGKISDKDSYGNDTNPPKDTKH